MRSCESHAESRRTRGKTSDPASLSAAPREIEGVVLRALPENSFLLQRAIMARVKREWGVRGGRNRGRPLLQPDRPEKLSLWLRPAAFRKKHHLSPDHPARNIGAPDQVAPGEFTAIRFLSTQAPK